MVDLFACEVVSVVVADVAGSLDIPLMTLLSQTIALAVMAASSLGGSGL